MQLYTHLCHLHLQIVAAFVPGVVVGDLLGGRLDSEDDLDVGEDDDDGGEDEAAEEDAQDEGPARQGRLRQPPVQSAGGAEGLRGVVSPAHQRHGRPERRVEPDEHQGEEGVTPLQPSPCNKRSKKPQNYSGVFSISGFQTEINSNSKTTIPSVITYHPLVVK